MYTNDFSIFTKMVSIIKDQKLEYKIFYTYHYIEKSSYSNKYSFLLATNICQVFFDRKFHAEEDKDIRSFLQNNDCIKLDFNMRMFDKESFITLS